MERPFFSPQSKRYMIEHMNEDHADSALMDTKVYGHLWSATAACMVTLDKESMDLEVTLPDGGRRLRITFEHRLQDEADAQRTLMALPRHAQEVMTRQAAQDSSRGQGEEPLTLTLSH